MVVRVISGKRYSIEDLRNNFIDVMNKANKIPLYNDFEEHTKISQITYASRLGFKGKVYDNIVKTYVTEGEFEIYLKSKLDHKSKVGKVTGKMTNVEIPEENLINELHRVFNFYFKNYNQYPSRRLFDKVAKHDSSVYRYRYNMSWTDICNMFGYKMDKSHKNEKMILGIIAKLLNSTYEPQKTWKWLIGVGGKNMFLDGYFEEYDLAVEYDGRQHRIPVDAFGGVEKFKIVQQNDKLKDKLIGQYGLKMLRVDSRDKWYDEEYLINRLGEIGIKIPNQQTA